MWSASNRAGFVYFIQETELLRVKIGFTTSHPAKRLKSIANASSQVLRFIGFEVGDERRSKALHQRFASLHVRNEWFAPGEELLEYVASLRYGTEFESVLQGFVLAPGQLKPVHAPEQGNSRSSIPSQRHGEA